MARRTTRPGSRPAAPVAPTKLGPHGYTPKPIVFNPFTKRGRTDIALRRTAQLEKIPAMAKVSAKQQERIDRSNARIQEAELVRDEWTATRDKAATNFVKAMGHNWFARPFTKFFWKAATTFLEKRVQNSSQVVQNLYANSAKQVAQINEELSAINKSLSSSRTERENARKVAVQNVAVRLAKTQKLVRNDLLIWTRMFDRLPGNAGLNATHNLERVATKLLTNGDVDYFIKVRAWQIEIERAVRKNKMAEALALSEGMPV